MGTYIQKYRIPNYDCTIDGAQRLSDTTESVILIGFYKRAEITALFKILLNLKRPSSKQKYML